MLPSLYLCVDDEILVACLNLTLMMDPIDNYSVWCVIDPSYKVVVALAWGGLEGATHFRVDFLEELGYTDFGFFSDRLLCLLSYEAWFADSS